MTKPSKNAVTGEYTNTHKGYDYSGRGDDGIYACLAGTVEQSVNLYNTAWENTGKLTTKDYGNFIKLKHDDGTFSLYAHLKKDSLLPVGTRVAEGQRIAMVGNTGNSTGTHLHFEYRNASNINIKPVFMEVSMPDMMEISIKDFERIRSGSERSEAVHKELGLEGDHVATPIDAFISAIKTLRGYQADATTMRRKLSEVEAEVLNREEQVGRLKDQLLKLDELKQAEAAVHSEAVKAAEKLATEYKVRLESMQLDIDEVYKEKGGLLNKVSVLESENAELKKGITRPLTLFDVIRLIVPKIIQKLKEIKL